MIVCIRARFACDLCDQQFSVALDPASKAPAEWSLFESAEDAIFQTGRGMVVEGTHLCPDCADRWCKCGGSWDSFKEATSENPHWTPGSDGERASEA